MPRFSSTALLACLEKILPPHDSSALCVAYSGGLDSTALLHAAARLTGEHGKYKLRAVHVDHQLHAQSSRWREHCAQVALQLHVEFAHVAVAVSPRAQEGREAAARKVRYDALRAGLAPGEVLLTAHHADDQLETVLLALMRGAGLRGLRGMPPLQRFGPGWLARPMLQFTRADLEQWARSEGLNWIRDPSNENTSLDRNYLRHSVAPGLRERWPAAARSASRSVSHLREAGELLDGLAAADVASIAVGMCLSVARLQALDPARRRNVLRHWLRCHGVRAPSTRKLIAMEQDIFAARADRLPCIEWDDVQVRRHRGLLYCMQRQPALATSDSQEWEIAGPLDLPAALGRLWMRSCASDGISAAKLPKVLDIRFRQGGEVLRPAGEAHRRPLKKLLQSSGVLPWWRDRLPLIYAAGQLVAVGDLWIAEEFAAGAGEAALRIVWEGKPRIEADSKEGTGES